MSKENIKKDDKQSDVKKDDLKKNDSDLILLHSPTDDGEGVNAIRSRSGKIDFAELRPLKEGQDISHNEVVNLRPRKETPLLCDVDVMYKPKNLDENSTSSTSHPGPPKISSQLYRKNYNRIFNSSKSKKNTLLN